MAVGSPADKAAIDARSAYLAVQIRDTLDAASRLKLFLDGKSVADLEALGYTADEAAVLKSAFTDLDNLRSVATGGQTVPAANNFLFWSSKLVGVN